MTAIPTSSYALTTVERLKVRLTLTTSGFDTLLGEIVASCTDFIERTCNRRFLQTSYTNEIYDGSNIDGTQKRVLLLKNAPMTAAPSSFQYRTGAKSTAVWVDFQVDTYQEVLSGAYIRVGLPSGFQNIRVSYIAGFLINFSAEFDKTQHTLPFEISDLCERLCTHYFKKRDSEGRDSESFNQSTVKWAELLSDSDQTILANHTRIAIV